MVANEVNRLGELARAKEDELEEYRRREYDMGLKLKEQQEW